MDMAYWIPELIYHFLLLQQWPVFLILWWPSLLWLCKTRCYWELCGRGNIWWINRGSEEINYIASHEQQTKVSRTCPCCNGSLGKSKAGGLCATRDLCMSLHEHPHNAHQHGNGREHMEQTGRRNKKIKVGRNALYIMGVNTSDTQSKAMKREDEHTFHHTPSHSEPGAGHSSTNTHHT